MTEPMKRVHIVIELPPEKVLRLLEIVKQQEIGTIKIAEMEAVEPTIKLQPLQVTAVFRKQQHPDYLTPYYHYSAYIGDWLRKDQDVLVEISQLQLKFLIPYEQVRFRKQITIPANSAGGLKGRGWAYRYLVRQKVITIPEPVFELGMFA
jgi:hypothetical protein